MKKRFVISTLALFFTLAHADVLPQSALPNSLTDLSCQPYKSNATEINGLVLNALRPRVHQLNRKVFFYHYATNRGVNATQAVNDDQSTAANYFLSTSDFFGDRKFRAGLYGAPDPLMTLDFSGQPGLLLKIGVPSGTKYLDDGTIHIPQNDSLKIWCYLRSQCTSAECQKDIPPAITEMLNPSEEIQDAQGNWAPKPAELTLQPEMFLPASQEATDLMKGIYQELGIEFTIDSYRDSPFGECSKASGIEAVFVDPTFSSKAELTLLSPVLETNPSPEKIAVYQSVFKYFNVFAFDSKTDEVDGDVVPAFWQYYKAWAPILDALLPDQDLVAHQAQVSTAARAKRSLITAEIFGCAANENEVIPSN